RARPGGAALERRTAAVARTRALPAPMDARARPARCFRRSPAGQPRDLAQARLRRQGAPGRAVGTGVRRGPAIRPGLVAAAAAGAAGAAPDRRALRPGAAGRIPARAAAGAGGEAAGTVRP